MGGIKTLAQQQLEGVEPFGSLRRVPDVVQSKWRTF
jgi:hypothetical protein